MPAATVPSGCQIFWKSQLEKEQGEQVAARCQSVDGGDDELLISWRALDLCGLKVVSDWHPRRCRLIERRGEGESWREPKMTCWKRYPLIKEWPTRRVHQGCRASQTRTSDHDEGTSQDVSCGPVAGVGNTVMRNGLSQHFARHHRDEREQPKPLPLLPCSTDCYLHVPFTSTEICFNKNT